MEPIAPKLILVPTDFSAPSAQALRYGAALAERFSAHLLVIYADPFVLPVDYSISGAGVFDLPRDEWVAAVRHQLQAFAKLNIAASVPYEVSVLVDTPVEAILHLATETGANLIVMGTHGRSGLRRLLLGSVTETVMRLAPVPVIVVHERSRLESAAMRRIVNVPRLTTEAAVALTLAGMLADARETQYVEVPEGADADQIARAADTDLLVLGLSDDHSMIDSLRGTVAERIVQHSACPVFTVNRFAAERATGRIHEHDPAVPA